MKALHDLDVKGKTVLVRLALDAPLKKGKVADDTRLKEALPTLRHLANAKQVIIIGHLGRPLSKNKHLALDPIAKHLSKLLKKPIVKVDDVVPNKLPKGKFVMLENLRFDPREKANDKTLAKELAVLADIYVNDAFSVCHRKAASITGIPKYLPSYAGIHLVEELTRIGHVLQHMHQPFVLILGGAKIDKLELLKPLVRTADAILIGGAMIFTFLKAQGHSIGRSYYQDDHVKLAKKIIKNKHVMLPVDIVLDTKKTVPIHKIPKSAKGLDIGKKTIKHFGDVLAEANTIIWNGPMGTFRDKPFDKGTVEIAKIIIKQDAVTVAGGGDTTESLKKYAKKFTYTSSAGGAFLALLSGKQLPGIKALK